MPPKPTQSYSHGYENIPEKEEEPLPPRQPKCEGYVNLPPKASSGPPELPPRKPSQTHAGYENIPTRDDSSSRTMTRPPYQNLPPAGMLLHESVFTQWISKYRKAREV